MREKEYLSDKELEELILQVEIQELVPAPPGLLDSLLECAELENGFIQEKYEVQNRSIESRRKEFHCYCIRVIASVAAAVAIVFLAPDMNSLQKPEREQEVFTREEALQESNILVRILEGVDYLEKEENGGSYDEEKKE